jgi:hypothetical protein
MSPTRLPRHPAVAYLFLVRSMQRPLSREDRQFIADQIEPITQLPLETPQDEDAWLAATQAVMQRLSARFPDVASVVPHHLYHYFDDADIHRKEPAYRAAQERRIIEFIRELRSHE